MKALVLTPPLLVALAAANPPADDWPHWLGPARDGISRETGWVSEGGTELWRAEVGMGYSSVSVAGGRLFTLGYDEDESQDVLWCLDAESGAVLWSKRWAADVWDEAHAGGSLTTPSVDGDALYVASREGRLYCLEAETGEERWFQDQFAEIDGADRHAWGWAASPLILGERLVMNAGRVVAYDKSTGERLWETERDYQSAYSTPAPLEHGGEPAIASFAGAGLTILRLEDGAPLSHLEWRVSPSVNAATPVITEKGVFIATGYGKGCAMVDVSKQSAEVVWSSKVMRNKMAGSLLYGGYLFGFDESVLKCIDLDGNEKWRKRGLGQGSHVIADGRLVILTSRGELVIADASPEGFRELARRKVLSGGRYWTTPVVANGLLYLRNSRGDLVCRDHRPENDAD